MRQIHKSLKYHEKLQFKMYFEILQDFCLALGDTGLSCVLAIASLFLCMEKFSYVGDPQDIEN
jgi:hypothetical protein